MRGKRDKGKGGDREGKDGYEVKEKDGSEGKDGKEKDGLYDSKDKGMYAPGGEGEGSWEGEDDYKTKDMGPVSKEPHVDSVNSKPEGEYEKSPIAAPVSGEGKKKKVLALHGGGGSGASFRAESEGMSALAAALGPDYAFVFADGQYSYSEGDSIVGANRLWVLDPPGGKNEPTTAADFD